jgi:hypothetical protein
MLRPSRWSGMTMAAVDDAPRGREVTLDREEDGHGDDRDWTYGREAAIAPNKLHLIEK